MLSNSGKQEIRERIKKQIEALKAKTKPAAPPPETQVEEGEETGT